MSKPKSNDKTRRMVFVHEADKHQNAKVACFFSYDDLHKLGNLLDGTDSHIFEETDGNLEDPKIFPSQFSKYSRTGISFDENICSTIKRSIEHLAWLLRFKERRLWLLQGLFPVAKTVKVVIKPCIGGLHLSDYCQKGCKGHRKALNDR